MITINNNADLKEPRRCELYLDLFLLTNSFEKYYDIRKKYKNGQFSVYTKQLTTLILD